MLTDEDSGGALATLTNAGIPAAQSERAVDDGLANGVGVETILVHTFLSLLHLGWVTHGQHLPALKRVGDKTRMRDVLGFVLSGSGVSVDEVHS